MKIFFLTAMIVSATLSGMTQSGGRILVAAASDLKFALDSIAAVYKLSYPDTEIAISYGSSGKLFEQIRRGAPYDMFFSADVDYAERLCRTGLCAGDIRVYGEGRIVLWSSKRNLPAVDFSTLKRPDIKKIAIANPLHAPYGKRAEEALTYYGVLNEVKPKLVYGENISQAAQFVLNGAADIGIIALSLAKSPVMKRSNGSYELIPKESHSPLTQGFVVLRSADQKKDVGNFSAFISGDAAQTILLYFGFETSR